MPIYQEEGNYNGISDGKKMMACYDRHISEIGEIMLTSHGVNKNGVATLMQTLRKMETHMQTAYGTSKKGYHSTEELAQYGTGQGNIVSIFICQFSMSAIFFLLEEKFKLWDVTDEDGNVLGCQLAIGFSFLSLSL